MTSLINEKTLKRIEDEKKDKTEFLVLTYDIPSENLTTIPDDLKRTFLNKRLLILNEVNTIGLRLNNSTYVVHIDRLENLLKTFERVYEEHTDRVNLKIVGNAYTDVVKDILVSDISSLIKTTTKDLELLEAKIEENNNDYQQYSSGKKRIDFEKISRENEKIKKRLYTHSKTLLTLGNRIEDLEKLDKALSDRFKKTQEKLAEYRRTLLDKSGH